MKYRNSSQFLLEILTSLRIFPLKIAEKLRDFPEYRNLFPWFAFLAHLMFVTPFSYFRFIYSLAYLHHLTGISYELTT